MKIVGVKISFSALCKVDAGDFFALINGAELSPLERDSFVSWAKVFC